MCAVRRVRGSRRTRGARRLHDGPLPTKEAGTVLGGAVCTRHIILFAAQQERLIAACRVSVILFIIILFLIIFSLFIILLLFLLSSLSLNPLLIFPSVAGLAVSRTATTPTMPSSLSSPSRLNSAEQYFSRLKAAAGAAARLLRREQALRQLLTSPAISCACSFIFWSAKESAAHLTNSFCCTHFVRRESDVCGPFFSADYGRSI